MPERGGLESPLLIPPSLPFTWRTSAALWRERSRQEPTSIHTRTFGACRSRVPAAPLPLARSLAHVPCTRATCTRSSCVSLRFSAAFLCGVSLRRALVLPADTGPERSPNARVMPVWPTLPRAPFAHAPLLVPSCYSPLCTCARHRYGPGCERRLAGGSRWRLPAHAIQ